MWADFHNWNGSFLKPVSNLVLLPNGHPDDRGPLDKLIKERARIVALLRQNQLVLEVHKRCPHKLQKNEWRSYSKVDRDL